MAVQSQNGINSDEDNQALQKEITALETEINRIASTTTFGGTALLDGTFESEFLVGADAGQTIGVSITQDFRAASIGLSSGVVLTSSAGRSAALAQIDKALSTVNSQRADLGAVQNRFQSTIRNLSNIAENVTAARSRIRDTDFAQETANLTKFQIQQQASTTILAQANQRPQAALSLLG